MDHFLKIFKEKRHFFVILWGFFGKVSCVFWIRNAKGRGTPTTSLSPTGEWLHGE